MSSSDSNDRSVYAQLFTMGPIATIAVALRFVARYKSKLALGLDDLFAVLAVVCYWVYIGLSLWGIRDGGHSKPLLTLQLNELIVSLKVLYWGVMFTPATISSAKLSVLFFYYRIFKVNKNFKIAWSILLFVTVAWFLATFILAIFKCTPITAAWNPFLVTTNCINLQRAFLISETINCITDFFIVCLPIAMIRTLRLSSSLKAGISVIFLLGGLVCVTSIVRIIYSYKSNGSSESLINAGLWVNIQLCAAIVCACLPVYRPILPSMSTLRELYPSFYSLVNRGSGGSRRSKTTTPNHTNEGPNQFACRTYKNISDGAVDQMVLTNVKCGSVSSREAEHDYPINAIRVHTDLSRNETRI
ncbi:hypothetical protein BGZ60DRAFT_559127 [Tricladium varicosporioides]|nr:hypothetical protein BGZ60DRAFT_559127 [Hymenoscyphus varicosporioides]